jgi:hypothetical protein
MAVVICCSAHLEGTHLYHALALPCLVCALSRAHGAHSVCSLCSKTKRSETEREYDKMCSQRQPVLK